MDAAMAMIVTPMRPSHFSERGSKSVARRYELADVVAPGSPRV